MASSAAARIDTSEAKRIERDLLTLGGLTIRVGILGAGASTLEADSSITLAELGMIHEYGTAEIPERSFLRRTFEARRADLAALKIAAFKAILAGQQQPRAALELIGQQMVAWVKETIRAGVDPALATETILRKGSAKPLIDDGQLINSITYEVVAA